MNRAVGKRTMFEDESDLRTFLACVIDSVRRREIRLIAFSFLTTHFHMLVESVAGGLAAALRRIESEYVRRFNRRRDRDGPLVRGRFLSKVVDDASYWIQVIRYIDDNPVRAGLVARAADYPHGSAFHYARQAGGPRWLHRTPVERTVRALRPGAKSIPEAYTAVFSESPTASRRDWIEARIRYGDRAEDPLRDLLRAAPAVVLECLKARTRLADGTRPGVPIVDVAGVDAALAMARAGKPWFLGNPRRPRDAWEVLTIGLYRTLCGDTLQAIASRIRRPLSTVRGLLDAHGEYLRAVPSYADAGRDVALHALGTLRTDLAGVAEIPRLRDLLAG
jgi:REP element-mobilizing transposase RayT